MSNWSHVAAVIRIDDFRMNDSVPDFEKLFGKTMTWDDMLGCGEEYDEKEYLPMGSEGSLEMSVWVNNDIHKIAAYTVTIFGDLRDSDSAEEIISWFKDKCELIDKDFLGVRNACIVVNNEWNGTVEWHR